jgi:hypothetical protein
MKLWETRIVQLVVAHTTFRICEQYLDTRNQLAPGKLNARLPYSIRGLAFRGSCPLRCRSRGGDFPLLNRCSIPRTAVTKPRWPLSPASTRKVNARSRGSGATNQILHPGCSLDVTSHSASEWGDKGGLRSGELLLCGSVVYVVKTINHQY